MVDGALGDEVRVTVIAAGFDEEPLPASKAAPVQKPAQNLTKAPPSPAPSAPPEPAASVFASRGGAHAAENPVVRPVVRPSLPVASMQPPAPASTPTTAPTNEVPTYVDDPLSEAGPELDVPRVIGVDAEKEEIELPDFLR